MKCIFLRVIWFTGLSQMEIVSLVMTPTSQRMRNSYPPTFPGRVAHATGRSDKPKGWTIYMNPSKGIVLVAIMATVHLRLIYQI